MGWVREVRDANLPTIEESEKFLYVLKTVHSLLAGTDSGKNVFYEQNGAYLNPKGTQ
jgi:hypothetical protein